jgi:hypothetical protein
MWQLREVSSARPRPGVSLRWLGVPALALTAGVAAGAEISGVVTGLDGAPLYRAPVCLRLEADAQECLKLRFTDRKGEYSFKGLKTGDNYTVSIFLDKAASARKFEAYKTYVWTPGSQSTDLARKYDAVALAPFVGKFNYSNYQRAIQMTAADFPELGQVDLSSQPVFLKVSYQPVQSPELPPETIFLGQVGDPAAVRLEATVPLAVNGIDYQLFSADFSYTGRISLAD